MKAVLFGSIGTLIESSNIQRESFNQAFREIGLDWYWDQEDYTKLLKKDQNKIFWTIGQFKFEYFGGSDVVSKLYMKCC